MLKSKSKMIGIVAGLLLAASMAAWAIQPGTTGTDKTNQQMGVRSGVLIQKNNTATATGSTSSIAATLNAAGSGVITTPSMATPADSEVNLTLTNNMIAAADIVLCSVALGTSTVGKVYCAEVKEAAGSVLIRVRNASGASTLNGTLRIKFVVLKQSALGSD